VQSHKKITWVAFLLATLSVPSRAQDMPALAPGARLRVAGTRINGPLVETVIMADGRSLTLDVKGKAEPLIVPCRDITTVERSIGCRSRGKGALIGATIGAVFGAAAGLALGCGGDNCWIRRGGAAVAVGAVGAGGGALLGAAVPPGSDGRSCHGTSRREPAVGEVLAPTGWCFRCRSVSRTPASGGPAWASPA
jgi:hypothetical protein